MPILGANATIKGLMVLVLFILFATLGYFMNRIYRNKKYFSEFYELENGKSTIADAVHGSLTTKKLAAEMVKGMS